jgi:hypothetical protein
MIDRTGQPSWTQLELTPELYQERIRYACLVTGLTLSAISKRAGLRKQLQVSKGPPPTSYMDRVSNFLGLTREQFCGPLPHFMAALDRAKATGWHDSFVAPRPAGIKFSIHPRYKTKCNKSDEPGEEWPRHFPIHARW